MKFLIVATAPIFLVISSCSGTFLNDRKNQSRPTGDHEEISGYITDAAEIEGKTTEQLDAELKTTKIRIPANAIDHSKVSLIRATLKDVSDQSDHVVILPQGVQVIEVSLANAETGGLITRDQILSEISITHTIAGDTVKDLMFSDGTNNFYISGEDLQQVQGLRLYSLTQGQISPEFTLPLFLPSNFQTMRFRFWADSKDGSASYESFSRFIPPTDGGTPGTQHSGSGATSQRLTVLSVSAVQPDGIYSIGAELSIQVQFSKLVVVDGLPQLTLETGTTDRVVNYASGSGSSILIFAYTIQAGDFNTDLDYIGTNALSLNGGTIRDQRGNDADLTLPVPGQADSLASNKSLHVDGVAPTVLSLSSTNSNGAYRAGESISITIQFSENIVVSGTPQLSLETGSTDRLANYSTGSNSSTLSFAYSVSSGDNSADLDATGTSALALNGGNLKDDAGNDAVLSLPIPGSSNSLGANKNIKIDTTAPPVFDTFNVTGGSAKATVTLDYPADTSDFAHVVVRRVSGNSAPADCSSGTLVTDRTSFNTDPDIFDDTGLVAGNYSYRLCVKDAAGNETNSQTVTAVTVTAGNPVWSTYQHQNVSNILNVGAAIATSNFAIAGYVADNGSDHDAYSTSFDGSNWSSVTQIDNSETFGISTIGFGFDASVSPIHVRGRGTVCWSGSQSMGIDSGGCDLIQGPSGKAAAVSNVIADGTPPQVPDLRLFDGSSWAGSTTTLPSGVLPSAFAFDQSGNFWGVFRDENTLDLIAQRYSGSFWVSAGVLNGATSFLGFREMNFAIFNSGAMGLFFKANPAISDDRIYAIRRNTSGVWQAMEELANSGTTLAYVGGGVDSSGKMIAAWKFDASGLNYKLFDGTSWDASPTNLTTNPVTKIEVCSSPGSSVMHLFWLEGSSPNQEIKWRKISSGTIDSSTTVLASSGSYEITDFDTSCNDLGYAVVAVKGANRFGTIQYVP